MSTNAVLFAVYPYLCIAMFACGALYHLKTGGPEWEGPPGNEPDPASPPMRKRAFTILLLHLTLLPIFFGHVLGLFVPASLYTAIGIDMALKQDLAIYIGGTAGIVALISGLMLLRGRFFEPAIRAMSQAADTFSLSLVLLALATGLATIGSSMIHADGAVMEKLMRWAQALATFRTTAALEQIADTPLIIKVHILTGLTMLLAIPVTSLSHIIWSPAKSVDMIINKEKYAAWRQEYAERPSD